MKTIHVCLNEMSAYTINKYIDVNGLVDLLEALKQTYGFKMYIMYDSISYIPCTLLSMYVSYIPCTLPISM